MNLSDLAQLYDATRIELDAKLNEAKHHIEEYERMRKEYVDTLAKRAIEDQEYINKLFAFLTHIQEEEITVITTKLGEPK